jgi:hypothetical protein
MDLNTLKTSNGRFGRLAKLATFGFLLGAGVMMSVSLLNQSSAAPYLSSLLGASP